MEEEISPFLPLIDEGTQSCTPYGEYLSDQFSDQKAFWRIMDKNPFICQLKRIYESRYELFDSLEVSDFPTKDYTHY